MRELPIAYGNSCKAKKWSNKKIGWETLAERLKNTIRTTETVEEYKKMKKAEKENAKDRGGFVGGVLKGGSRKGENVLSRSMFTGDLDQASPDFVERYSMLSPYESILYSTHGHTPEAPRIRILVPFRRDVTPEEYVAIARYFAEEWGIDQFDECSYRVQQLMYWPTTPADGEYVCERVEGEWLDPDVFLTSHPHWRDLSTLPTSSRESAVRDRKSKRAVDPTTKDGVVGVFCRCFSISDVMENFLSDVYAPSAMEGRYDYIPADSVAGVVVYDNLFAYSHHATDPACGLLLNAFDLVRVHKFGNEEDSFSQMMEFAQGLDTVKKKLLEEKQEKALEEFGESDDWTKGLTFAKKTGEVENTLLNATLILTNDPDYQSIKYNEMMRLVEVVGLVPWDRPKEIKFWRDTDDSQLRVSLARKYTDFSKTNYEAAFQTAVDGRRYHPIRSFLDALPAWDGTKRVETLLMRCLGAEDSKYVREVTKKTFAAAVARIYSPGIKFDSLLVLDGVQGIGKSTFFKDLVGDQYYSDTLSLTDMNDKSGAEKLQGSWVVEIAELAGMKKADIERVKAFLSTADDKYRASYAKVVESHPRQCIIFASVNGDRGYLRDITGNRRFWVVKLGQKVQGKKWNFSDEEKKQIWAEAKALWEAGEKLYLEGEMVAVAEEVQKQAMEEDERRGVVEQYLEMLLPKNWDQMDLYARRNYISEKDAPTAAVGVKKRESVSNMEIWCECFGRSQAELRPQDSYNIAALMEQIPGWERGIKAKVLPIYGRQRLYIKEQVE